jgi:tetratricopeptide (TPR) repeat protein
MKIRTVVVGILTLMFLSQPYHRIEGKQPSPPTQTNTAQAYWEQGNEYLKADRCAEAVEAFKKALAISEATAAYNDLGRAYLCLAEFPKGETSFKQALRIRPNNLSALYNLGVAYARQVKIEQANMVLRELQSKDPEAAKKLQIEIGYAHETDRALESAKKLFEAMREKREKEANYMAEGNKYFETKDYVRAIEAYKKAISVRPSSEAYNALGVTYDALKQYSNAVSAFQEAIRIKPDDHESHYNLAAVYAEMGEYEKSEGSSREALRLKPDYADAINMLGVVASRRKQYAEAVTEFERAIRLTPNDGVFYHNLGKTYFLMGRKEDAQRVYRKLLTFDKESARRLYEVMNPPSRKRNF